MSSSASTFDTAPDLAPVAKGNALRRYALPTGWSLYTLLIGAMILVPVTLYFSRAFESVAFDRLFDTPQIGKVLVTTILLAAGKIQTPKYWVFDSHFRGVRVCFAWYSFFFKKLSWAVVCAQTFTFSVCLSDPFFIS